MSIAVPALSLLTTTPPPYYYYYHYYYYPPLARMSLICRGTPSWRPLLSPLAATISNGRREQASVTPPTPVRLYRASPGSYARMSSGSTASERQRSARWAYAMTMCPPPTPLQRTLHRRLTFTVPRCGSNPYPCPHPYPSPSPNPYPNPYPHPYPYPAPIPTLTLPLIRREDAVRTPPQPALPVRGLRGHH